MHTWGKRLLDDIRSKPSQEAIDRMHGGRDTLGRFYQGLSNRASGYGMNNMLRNKGYVTGRRTALQAALYDAENNVTTPGGGGTTPGASPWGAKDLIFKPISVDPYNNLIRQNEQFAKERIDRWTKLMADKNSYQSELDITKLMAMGPKDWANPQQTANERARLQYAPQIASSEFERTNMKRQGLQNKADISGWYGLVDSAMADAQTLNTAATRGFSDFATDSSKSLMESLGGASNAANAAVAATSQSNNDMLSTLGLVQGNYLANSRENARREGAQQGINQMRLNDNADRLAAQQILDLQGKQGASASDYRFTMEGQNRDLQSQRLATQAGLLGENARINAANDSTRLTFQQMLDQAGSDRLTGRRAIINDRTGTLQLNATGELGAQKSNIDLAKARQLASQTGATTLAEASQKVLNMVLNDKNQLKEFKTLDDALGYIGPVLDALETATPGIRKMVLDRLGALNLKEKPVT